MGRGSSKLSGGGVSKTSVLGKPEPTEFRNEKNRSSGSVWKRTNLEAVADKNSKGTLILDFPKDVTYEQANSNTTYARGVINHGFINTANGSMSGRWVGINWDNVKEVKGETFDVKGMLKEKGFKWDRNSYSWKKTD